jgi:hypothetical protein
LYDSRFKIVRMKNLPKEVSWALAVQHGNTPISVDTYDKLLKIIEDNPDHFKWEHKYWSIPDEVHEAYHKDVSEMRNKVIPSPPPFSISVSEMLTKPTTSDLTVEQLESFLKEVQLRELQQAEYERKKHKLWKKHYGPYKLKYR